MEPSYILINQLVCNTIGDIGPEDFNGTFEEFQAYGEECLCTDCQDKM